MSSCTVSYATQMADSIYEYLERKRKASMDKRYCCAECLEVLIDPVVGIRCGHVFDAECMQRLMTSSSACCPVCQDPLPTLMPAVCPFLRWLKSLHEIPELDDVRVIVSRTVLHCTQSRLIQGLSLAPAFQLKSQQNIQVYARKDLYVPPLLYSRANVTSA